MCLLKKVQMHCRICLTTTGYILEMDSNLIEYFTLNQPILRYFLGLITVLPSCILILFKTVPSSLHRQNFD